MGYMSRLRILRLTVASPVARSDQVETIHSSITSRTPSSPITNSTGEATSPTAATTAVKAPSTGQ